MTGPEPSEQERPLPRDRWPETERPAAAFRRRLLQLVATDKSLRDRWFARPAMANLASRFLAIAQDGSGEIDDVFWLEDEPHWSGTFRSLEVHGGAFASAADEPTRMAIEEDCSLIASECDLPSAAWAFVLDAFLAMFVHEVEPAAAAHMFGPTLDALGLMFPEEDELTFTFPLKGWESRDALEERIRQWLPAVGAELRAAVLLTPRPGRPRTKAQDYAQIVYYRSFLKRPFSYVARRTCGGDCEDHTCAAVVRVNHARALKLFLLPSDRA